jgi:transposase
MDNLSHGRVIGIDAGRDWLDVHCLPDGHRCRLANAPAGHRAVADLARNREDVGCFESTGGQEWPIWALLEKEGIAARHLPRTQVKVLAQSRGTRSKTDRIDAELIARCLALRPDERRCIPAEKLCLLRALTSKRSQLIEMCKRLLAQIRANQKLGTAAIIEDADTELKQRIDSLIQELEDRITLAIASDDRLSEMAIVLCSIPGIGPVASTMLIAEMPEIGTITSEKAAALTGWAPVATDFNPSLKSFADRHRKAGKPHKFIITAVARKLVTIANALCRCRQKWAATAP